MGSGAIRTVRERSTAGVGFAAADRAARIDAVLALGRAAGAGAQVTLGALAFDKALDAELRKAAYRALRRARRADAAAAARTAPPTTAPSAPEVTP